MDGSTIAPFVPFRPEVPLRPRLEGEGVQVLPWELRQAAERALAAPGARDRAEARARAAVMAATHAAKWVLPEGAEMREVSVLASLLLHLEVVGSGGSGDLGGAQRASERAFWAHGLGKGRARASDGAAWDAALLRAIMTMARGVLTILPSGEGLAILEDGEVAAVPVGGFLQDVLGLRASRTLATRLTAAIGSKNREVVPGVGMTEEAPPFGDWADLLVALWNDPKEEQVQESPTGMPTSPPEPW